MRSEELAYEIRENAIKMVNHAHASHLGGILSCADAIAVLYAEVAHINPKNPKDPKRDRIVLSKGHNGAAVYVALAKMGFFDEELLKTYGDNGGMFSCHISHKEVPGVEVSTGSLGQGVCMACGFAIAAKRKKEAHKIYAIVGDGECDEGSVWEMALLAAQEKLDNFTVIIDRNYQQAMGRIEEVINTEPFADKWKAFGWTVVDVEDGNNHEQLRKAFEVDSNGKPKVIIARTIKGKGVSFMEDNLLWHYRDPQGEDYENALKEVEEKYAKSCNR